MRAISWSLSRITCAVAACFAASSVAAFSNETITPASTAVFYTFPGKPIVTISEHGNLIRFEGPLGYDHIGIGDIGEGYVLCYGPVRAWDLGSSESGFGAATASCSGQSCTITRSTNDGVVRLRQVILKSKNERKIDVTMTLTNLSAASIGPVILRRQVDFDVDGGGVLGTGTFSNYFASSEGFSVFAWNAPNANAGQSHMMLLRTLSPTASIESKVTDNILDNTCSPPNAAAAGPVFGDKGATIQHNLGVLGGGSSVTVTVQYQRN